MSNINSAVDALPLVNKEVASSFGPLFSGPVDLRVQG